MRLLFLSNYFPPYTRGGYELWCQEVAESLVERGHAVTVLTSQTPAGQSEVVDAGLEVHRKLHLQVVGGLGSTFWRLYRDRRQLDEENLIAAREVIASHNPEVVLNWGMWNLTRTLPAEIEVLVPGRVAYYLCDYWLSLTNAYEQQLENPSRRWITSLPKRMISLALSTELARVPQPELQLRHPICVSQAVKDILVKAGVPVSHARVVHGGTSQNGSPGADRARARTSDVLKLLYAGRLTSSKGVHTAVEAMGLLPANERDRVSLSLYGKGDRDYVQLLESTIRNQGLADRVTLNGFVSPARMHSLLAKHDALLFPSTWEEPFARIVLEAMAAGVVVIGTTTGGTGEVLVDNVTGLTFPPEDAPALAAQIMRLNADPSLLERLSQAGSQIVSERFSFRRMVDELETLLFDISRLPV